MPDAVDHHLKRLDHLQGIVQRLAGNSFLIKGWALTLVSAVLGFALKDPPGTEPLAYLALMPILLFWGLDAYYLAVERRVRRLYNDSATALRDVLSAVAQAQLADLRIDVGAVGVTGWFRAAFATSTLIMYLLLALCAFAVGSGAFLRAAKSMVLEA